LPGGSVYLPGPPIWWVLGFDLIGIAIILVPAWTRRGLLLLIAWLGLLLGMAWWPRSSDELRLTFVSVGHGGCTVIECPDGRVLLVDVGTLSGPEAVRRSVAPFLWHRGIRRVDELFLSHADLDHFNGLPELLRRFPVGRITMTPSFAEKPTPEVATTLAAIRKAKVPVRIAVAGDRFETDDVTIDVLHPPPEGPKGTENERSLVLRLTHAGHAILLTGDLEKQGTTLVKTLPAEPVDLLMAPHHGSRAAWNEGLARWAIPRFVIVNRGMRTGGIGEGDAGPGVPVWDTQTKGAITIRSHLSGLTAEAFRDGERAVIKK
jgi:competence protein ComEC